MGDLIRSSMGGTDSSTVSMSFWFNCPDTFGQILDCTGLFFSGHNLPSIEDAEYNSLQVGTAGRAVYLAVGNPRGEEACVIEQYEGGINGDHGPIGEAGSTAESSPSSSYGRIYATNNSTGPVSSFFGSYVENLFPDGFTYYTGWGYDFTGSGTAGGTWQAFKQEAEARLAVLQISQPSNPALAQFAEAIADVSAYTASVAGDGSTTQHAASSVSNVHKGAVYETYKPSQYNVWQTNDVCDTLGKWNHVAFCIDTGHAGPYPNAPYFDQDNNVWVFSPLITTDLKRAKIVVNGVLAQILINGVPTTTTDPTQEGFSSDIGYTSSYSMDFSSTKVGIPLLNNDRLALTGPNAGRSNYTSPLIRMAALQVWPGQYIDWTDSNNFSKVVRIVGTQGIPANLSSAGIAFGTPLIRMDGDHLHFPINTGTGGSFTKDGTVVDYRPTPSYG